MKLDYNCREFHADDLLLFIENKKLLNTVPSRNKSCHKFPCMVQDIVSKLFGTGWERFPVSFGNLDRKV